MRNENDRTTLGAETADMFEQLPGDRGIKGRCRLVEDDETWWCRATCKSGSDLDHLTFRQGQVADDHARFDPVSGKDFVESTSNPPGSRFAPAKPCQITMWNSQIFQYGQVWA